MTNLETFTQAYIEAALWSSEPDGETWFYENRAPETQKAMRDDCADFLRANEPLLMKTQTRLAYAAYLRADHALCMAYIHSHVEFGGKKLPRAKEKQLVATRNAARDAWHAIKDVRP